MRRISGHILVFLTLMLMLVACGRKHGVIPPHKMSNLFLEMFIADQWLQNHPQARQKADTSLFFDPIFQKNGCSYEKYTKSLDYYLDDPEEFAKIVTKAAEELKRLSLEKTKEAERQKEAKLRKEQLRSKYWDAQRDTLLWRKDTLSTKLPSDTINANKGLIRDTILTTFPSDLRKSRNKLIMDTLQVNENTPKAYKKMIDEK